MPNYPPALDDSIGTEGIEVGSVSTVQTTEYGYNYITRGVLGQSFFVPGVSGTIKTSTITYSRNMWDGGGSAPSQASTMESGGVTESGGTQEGSSDGGDVGGTPSANGNNASLENVLPPSRLIGESLLPFRVNHRFRGKRESSKFLVVAQKYFAMFLRFRELLRPSENSINGSLDSIYVSSTDISKLQHCLAQLRFYEDVRKKVLPSRWFI